MTRTREINGRAWARRHMRDVRVTVFDEETSIDADPVTLEAAKTRSNVRERVRCSIVENKIDDVDAEGDSVGVRDLDMMVDDEAVLAEQRVEITFCRFDSTLVGRLGTVETVDRDPTNPMRRMMVRLDDHR